MQILHRPLSANQHPEKASERCPDLLARYLAHFPNSEAANIDFEDWAENTLMLAALEDQARKLALPLRLLETGGAVHYSGITGQTPDAAPGATPTVMWGCFRPGDTFSFPERANLHWNNRQIARTVARWPLSETFRRHAGRHVEILDMSIDAVRGAFSRLKAAGHTQAFLKTVEKSWSSKVDLSEDVPVDMAWDIIANEGATNALILQGLITPACEYRVFVVGDRPVTGTGCIESFTPLDRRPNEETGFDPRVEADRNRGVICEHPALVESYREFAAAFASSWAAEHGPATAYTLDLCVDLATREIVPIELNPMLNTGLYASDPARLAQALVAPLRSAA